MPSKTLADEASGKTGTARALYGFQDTPCNGAPACEGRVNRQTVMDTCRKVANATACAIETPVTVTGRLNDRVPPFQGV
ncbi:MAG: hypothetical protein DWQ08_07185 [Proteobacteria bacterium]|nr:MAG: hypothetical protein DWQ08_07185 [Pseudomonadota bacterium]